jgi:WD40 repeat protein
VLRARLQITCTVIVLLLSACFTPRTVPVVVPSSTASVPPKPQFSGELLSELPGSDDYDGFLFFSPDDQYLAYWAPGQADVFNVSTGSRAVSLPKGTAPISFSADSARLFTLQYPHIQSWLLSEPEAPETTWGDLTEASKSGDGSWRTSMTKESKTLYSVADGRPLKHEPDARYGYYQQYSTEAKLIAGPDGLFDLDSQARLFSFPSSEVEGWEALRRDISTVGVSPDGKLLVLGTMGGSLVLVDLASKTPQARLLVRGEIRCLDFSDDGRLLAVGCGDLTSDITVFDVEAREVFGTVSTGTSNSWAVAFSHSGEQLAVASDDGKIRIWEVGR